MKANKGTKRTLVLLGIMLVLLIYTGTAFAGDIPESALLGAENALLGTVEKNEGSIVTLKISEVLFGGYSEDMIEISGMQYSEGLGKTGKPKPGDYCVVVVNADNTVYEYLCARADSLDRETLKLKSSHPFIERMNNYINNGWYSNENREAILKRIEANEPASQAVTVQAATVQGTSEQADILQGATDQASTVKAEMLASPLPAGDTADEATSQVSVAASEDRITPGSNLIYAAILILIIAASVAFTILKRRRKTHQKEEQKRINKEEQNAKKNIQG